MSSVNISLLLPGCERALGSSGAIALDTMKPVTAPMTMTAIRSAKGDMSLVQIFSHAIPLPCWVKCNNSGASNERY